MHNTNFFIETESVKYIGSKLKILPYIYNILLKLRDVKIVFDGFSGSTRCSQMFAKLGYQVYSNDLSYLSQTLARCYLLHSPENKKYYQELIDYFNHLKGEYGWFSEYYGGRLNDTKKPFQLKNMKKLDAIRNEIDRLNLDKISKSICLTSLVLALDKVDSTLGHFTSYLREWSKRSYETMYLCLPKKFKVYQNYVARKDVFNCLDKEFDLAYYDPPYGSANNLMPSSRVRYNSYYHFWTSVILNDEPELFGKVNRRQDSRDNDDCVFESYKKKKNKFLVEIAFEKLLKNTKAHYVLFSYSSLGRVSKSNLLDILGRYKIKYKYEIDYKKNVMAEMKSTRQWVNEKSNKEFLFLIEK